MLPLMLIEDIQAAQQSNQLFNFALLVEISLRYKLEIPRHARTRSDIEDLQECYEWLIKTYRSLDLFATSKKLKNKLNQILILDYRVAIRVLEMEIDYFDENCQKLSPDEVKIQIALTRAYGRHIKVLEKLIQEMPTPLPALSSLPFYPNVKAVIEMNEGFYREEERNKLLAIAPEPIEHEFIPDTEHYFVESLLRVLPTERFELSSEELQNIMDSFEDENTDPLPVATKTPTPISLEDDEAGALRDFQALNLIDDFHTRASPCKVYDDRKQDEDPRVAPSRKNIKCSVYRPSQVDPKYSDQAILEFYYEGKGRLTPTERVELLSIVTHSLLPYFTAKDINVANMERVNSAKCNAQLMIQFGRVCESKPKEEKKAGFFECNSVSTNVGFCK